MSSQPPSAALPPSPYGTLRASVRWLALCALLAAPARAVQYPGFLPMVTDSMAVFTIPESLQPLYLQRMQEPTFGTAIMRITGDAGDDVGTLGPAWSTIVRHVYSKQQPWNANSLLLSLSNAGLHPNPLILNGQTYQPRYEPCSAYDHYDWRWHPDINHRNEQINVNRDGTELSWWDVETCTKTRSWTLPIVADYGIGMGEGNVSNGGRYVAIANQSQMVVVDMDPQAPNAPPYPHIRIGPVFTFAPCSLDVTRPDSGRISHVSISPSGKYLTVKYRGLPLAGFSSCDTLCDMRRVYEVDSSLTIKVHNMASSSARCGSFAARPNGWIFPLKHADLALDPFDNNEDVVIGGRACPGSKLGRVVKVRLRDGLVTALSNPTNEPPYNHGSARAIQRPGWFYVTYSRDPQYQGFRFWGEVVAYKMDGSGEVQRFGHYHSTQSFFESEAQAVPSPDGKRVLIASDWLDHCGERCGVLGQVGTYVLDARENALVDVPVLQEPTELRLSSPQPNPTRDGLVLRVALPTGRPAALELFDVTGRRLAIRNVGLMGAGEHVVDLDEQNTLPAGVYLVTLTDGRHAKSTKAVVLR